jgi:hypothetical protein
VKKVDQICTLKCDKDYAATLKQNRYADLDLFVFKICEIFLIIFKLFSGYNNFTRRQTVVSRYGEGPSEHFTRLAHNIGLCNP